MFGGNFFIDERPLNLLKTPAIYVFSRPFNLKSVKPNNTRKMYTTASLKQAMLCNEKIRDNIEVINDDGLPYTIELSNGEIVRVTAFSWGSKALNVVLLFEHQSKYTLWAGHFISTCKIVENRLLAQLMRQNLINELHVDTTAYNITEFNLKRTACKDIQTIIENADYKYHMLIDSFGYENVIFELARNGVKILLDVQSTEIFRIQKCLHHFSTDQEEADIILVKKLAQDTEKQFREEKIISIKLATNDGIKSSDHLRIVKYTPYPTRADIFYIARLATPEIIWPINDTSTIPDELRDFCR